MKEIDFLPEWYKTGKRRRGSYRRQYIVIAGLFATMLTWSFAASYSISAVEAQVDIMQKSLDGHHGVEAKFNQYNQAFSLLKERANRLDRLVPSVGISAIFAELSYTATDNIILTKLEITSEKFKDESGKSMSGRVGSRSRKQEKNSAMPDPESRYKIHITGVAAAAADVNSYISQMEKSQYFCLVVPELIQQMKDSTTADFQISCYIDNYVTE